MLLIASFENANAIMLMSFFVLFTLRFLAAAALLLFCGKLPRR